jgi:hypothetical protein
MALFRRKSAVKIPSNLGMLLLAVYLILFGLTGLLNLTFSGLPMLMAILAVAAGVLLLLGR